MSISLDMRHLDATTLGSMVNGRLVSPTEVIEWFAKRIEARDAEINAFTYLELEEAMNDARKLERRLAKGEYCGPFAGVPIALKDFLPSKKGWTNSHGGVKSLIAVDDADSMFYSAASKLGAIAIGKTNAPAFGFSGACQNALYGPTANPFDTSRTSGGSSGGSAAAVAAGMVVMAEGGDAGGSIRIPSGWCNLFGFKPSLGTVPSYCRPDGWAATHPYCFNGAITRSVTDSAIMLSHMAQYNPRDPISLPINAGKAFEVLMDQPIKGKRIAFTYDFGMYIVDLEIMDIVYNAAKRLEDAGAVVEFVDFDFKYSLDQIMDCWSWAISVDTAIDLKLWKDQGLDLVKDHRDELPEDFIKFNEIASKATIFDMRHFNQIRTDILDNFEDVFEKFDIIISPTAACKPMKLYEGGKCREINGIKMNPKYSFISFGMTPMCNFIGYPAASIPAGMTADGLPVGMQIIGKQYRDEDVFAVSRTFEQLQPWEYFD